METCHGCLYLDERADSGGRPRQVCTVWEIWGLGPDAHERCELYQVAVEAAPAATRGDAP